MFNTEKVIRMLLWISIHNDKEIPEEYWLRPNENIVRSELPRFVQSQLTLQNYLECIIRDNALAKRIADILNIRTSVMIDSLLQLTAYTPREKLDTTLADIYEAFATLDELLRYDKIQLKLKDNFTDCITELLALPTGRLVNNEYPI